MKIYISSIFSTMSKCLILFFLVFSSGVLFSQNPIHVDAFADGAGTGDSWDNAVNTIEDALSVWKGAEAARDIWVASGIYETAELELDVANKDLNILGGFLPGMTRESERDWFENETTLNANGTANAFIVGDESRISLNGFTIRNSGEAVIRSESQTQVRIVNCKIIEFASIWLCNGGNESSFTLANSLIRENISTNEPLINEPLINVVGDLESLRIINNTFNSCNTSFIVLIDGTPNDIDFINNYIDKMGSSLSNYLTYSNRPSGEVQVFNNLFGEGNENNPNNCNDPVLASPTLTTEQCSGDFFNVPVNYDGDLVPNIGSTSIDAGFDISSILPALALDLNGNNRVENGKIDIGAFERQANPTRIYVDNNLATMGAGDGLEWESAFKDLQDALDLADDGDSIWIASSSSPYMPDGLGYTVSSGVRIYGGFEGSETDFEERDYNAHRATIKPDESTQFLFNSVANPVYTTSLIIDGLLLQGNPQGNVTAIMSNSSDAVFTHLIINECKTAVNGSLNDGQNMVLSNSLISNMSGDGMNDNVITVVTGINGSVNIFNNTFANMGATQRLLNIFEGDANAVADGAKLLVTNNIFWKTGNDIEFVVDEMALSIRNNIWNDFTSCPQGLSCELNNFFDTDPRFVDTSAGNFQLMSTSPAVNMGRDLSNQALKDNANNDRVFDGFPNPDIVDIGAYELQQDLCNPFNVTLATDNNPNRGGECGDLRYALEQANLSTGEVITFAATDMEIDLRAYLPSISTPVTITGSLDGMNRRTIVSGANIPASRVIQSGFQVVANEVTIENLRITGFTTSTADFSDNGITVFGGNDGDIDLNNVVIRNNEIFSNNGGGIVVQNAKNTGSQITIESNLVYDNGGAGTNVFNIGVNETSALVSVQENTVDGTTADPSVRGVSVFNSENLILKTNSIRNVQTGIFITEDVEFIGEGITVDGNTIGSVNNGIELIASSKNTIINNSIGSINNVVGLDGIKLSSSSNSNTIFGNLVSTCGNYGVLISGSDQTIFGGVDPGQSNSISGNFGGVRIEEASQTTIRNSAIASSDSIGLDIVDSDNITISESSFFNNRQQGITISGLLSTAISVVRNSIGIKPEGMVAANGAAGILIFGGATNNTIGSDTITDANIISGNGTRGIRISGTGTSDNIIQNNFIGTNVSGGDLGNALSGIQISDGATKNSVLNNVIGKNDGDGILIVGASSTGHVITGNYIGTNKNSIDIGNSGAGIKFTNGASSSEVYDCFIGFNNEGIAIGPGNGTDGPTSILVGNCYIGVDVEGNNMGNLSHGFRTTKGSNIIVEVSKIAYNGGYGIAYFDETSNNDHSGDNKTYANSLGGIHIANEGMSTGNGMISKPVITGFDGTTVSGTYLPSEVPDNVVGISVYADDSTQGRMFLGIVSGPSNGVWSFDIPADSLEVMSMLGLDSLTAIQTDENMSTSPSTSPRYSSEFSEPMGLNACDPLVVTKTTDDGTCGTLRNAISYVNANAVAGITDTIKFDFTRLSTPWVIEVGSSAEFPNEVLPEITVPVVIDGWSEPSWASAPVVEIDGRNITSGTLESGGLEFKAGSDSSVVRGLSITGFDYGTFDGFGLIIESSGTNIQGNYLGISLNGTTTPNRTGIFIATSVTAGLVGTNADGIEDELEGNVVSGNKGNGISVQGNNILIKGNKIGTNPDGTDRVPNRTGVDMNQASKCTIGGTTILERNTIAYNIDTDFTLSGSSDNNLIIGNYIGANETGVLSLETTNSVIIRADNEGNIFGDETDDGKNFINNLVTQDNEDGDDLGTELSPVSNQWNINTVYGEIQLETGSQEDIAKPTITEVRFSDSTVIGTCEPGATIYLYAGNAVGLATSFIDTIDVPGTSWEYKLEQSDYDNFTENSLDSLIVTQTASVGASATANSSAFSNRAAVSPCNPLVVTKTTDDGSCGTLRGAVNYVTQLANFEEITFDLVNETILLDSTLVIPESTELYLNADPMNEIKLVPSTNFVSEPFMLDGSTKQVLVSALGNTALTGLMFDAGDYSNSPGSDMIAFSYREMSQGNIDKASFAGFGIGVLLQSSSHGIEFSEFYANGKAVEIEGNVNNIRIELNQFHGIDGVAHQGIHYFSSADPFPGDSFSLKIINNRFYDFSESHGVTDLGFPTKNLLVENNTFGLDEMGIAKPVALPINLGNLELGRIRNNTIVGGAYGIQLTDSLTDVLTVNNVIRDAQDGIRFIKDIPDQSFNLSENLLSNITNEPIINPTAEAYIPQLLDFEMDGADFKVDVLVLAGNEYKIELFGTPNDQADVFLLSQTLDFTSSGDAQEISFTGVDLTDIDFITATATLIGGTNTNNSTSPLSIALPTQSCDQFISGFLGEDIVTVCQADTIIKSSIESLGYTYTWENGFNLNERTISDTGEFILQIDSAGCVAVDSVTISKFAPDPDLGITNSTPGGIKCPESNASIEADDKTDGSTIEWVVNDVLSTEIGFNIFSPEAGDYYFVKTLDGCRDTSATVTINDHAVDNDFIVEDDIAVCSTDTILTQLNDGNGYNWYDGLGNVLLGADLEVNTSGEYIADTVDNNGCMIGDTVNLAFGGATSFDFELVVTDPGALCDGIAPLTMEVIPDGGTLGAPTFSVTRTPESPTGPNTNIVQNDFVISISVTSPKINDVVTVSAEVDVCGALQTISKDTILDLSTCTATGPVAVDDNVSTNENTSVTFNVLDNDVEGLGSFDGIVLSPLNSLLTTTSNGTLTINPLNLGSITYTPNADFTGIDKFQYQVVDDEGESDTATVFITVTVTPSGCPLITIDQPNTSICDGPVNLAASSLEDISNYSFEWSFNTPENKIADANTGTYTALVEGNYILSYTNPDNASCSGQDSTTVLYGQAQPSITISTTELEADAYDSYQWYVTVDGTKRAIVGANQQNYRYLFSGEYFVEVAQDNCTLISDGANVTTTNGAVFKAGFITTEDEIWIPQTAGELVVLPNPSDGDLTGEFSSYNSEVMNVSLLNAQGIELFKSAQAKTGFKTKLYLGDLELPSGVYFLLVTQGAEQYMESVQVVR